MTRKQTSQYYVLKRINVNERSRLSECLSSPGLYSFEGDSRKVLYHWDTLFSRKFHSLTVQILLNSVSKCQRSLRRNLIITYQKQHYSLPAIG